MTGFQKEMRPRDMPCATGRRPCRISEFREAVTSTRDSFGASRPRLRRVFGLVPVLSGLNHRLGAVGRDFPHEFFPGDLGHDMRKTGDIMQAAWWLARCSVAPEAPMAKDKHVFASSSKPYSGCCLELGLQPWCDAALRSGLITMAEASCLLH